MKNQPLKTAQIGRNNNRGFTLVELLVVLLILGMLGGLVGPRVMKYIGSAKSDTTALQIDDISAALDLYYLEVGRYPSSQEGISALAAAPGGVDGWNGPYLKKGKVPTDPWGNEYHYAIPGDHGEYDLYSLGADNSIGGEGKNEDITNWD